MHVVKIGFHDMYHRFVISFVFFRQKPIFTQYFLIVDPPAKPTAAYIETPLAVLPVNAVAVGIHQNPTGENRFSCQGFQSPITNT
jgi:hypothetical protein